MSGGNIGLTNNLTVRGHRHRSGVGSTFTAKHGVKMLVWCAIAREKQLKRWELEWKLALIEHSNREWADLYERLNARLAAWPSGFPRPSDVKSYHM
jgi:putative endonuclease